jgi:3-oxoacyl-[acyl-carrier-protein] synthase-3
MNEPALAEIQQDPWEDRPSADPGTQAVRIVGTGSRLPDRVVPNAEFEQTLDTSDEWIRTRTGMRERRFAAVSDTTSQLAADAAQAALSASGLSPEQLDLILLATTTPDMRLPATANFVQRHIGAMNAYAYDVSVACSGFVFALASAHAQIRAGMAKTALVIGAEVYSSIMDFADRSTCVLFGDGAGAVVLRCQVSGVRCQEEERQGGSRRGSSAGVSGWTGTRAGMPAPRPWQSAREPGILAVSLHSNGTYADTLQCDGSGTAGRKTHRVAGPGKIHMDGRLVFRLAVQAMCRASRDVLAKAGLDIADVDWLVPHQANIRIVWKLAKDLHCPPEKMVVNLDRVGNTSSASIPIALDEGVRDGRIQPGELVLLTAVGAGLSSGAVLLRM